MRSLGRYDKFDVLEQEPSKPFLEDLKTDLKNIDNYNTPQEAKQIKKEMIEEILKSI